MTSTPSGAPAGAIGGAAGDAGVEYRRRVGAFFAAHGLNGIAVAGVRVPAPQAVVEWVAVETDRPVDDVEVGLRDGYGLWIQAKLRLRRGAVLDEVARQWLRAVRGPGFDARRTRLVVCAAAMPRWTRVVARVFDRERDGLGGSRTAEEQREVEGFEAALADATRDEMDAIASAVVFLDLNLEEGGADSERARLLLDGRVVVAGEGSQAWRDLVHIAGRLGRGRSGARIESWLEGLRHAERTLVEDEDASRAARLEVRRRAVVRYRKLLRDRGAVLDLRFLGADIPPIPLSEMDAGVRVTTSDASPSDRHRELLWAFRRRGRVLLTGLPGGGKTTALRRVAGECAGYRPWGLPVFASMKRVAEISPSLSFREGILTAATEALPARDRARVREAIEAALENGTATLFVDGLDEAGSRRHQLVAELDALLKTCHRDVDVLLATRDVAYAQAATLGFADLRLRSPEDLETTIEAVLAAAAEARAIAADDKPAWMERRTEWVKGVISANGALRETPLMPVLLTLLASESEVDDLPRSRALVLERVIRDLVHRAEQRRPDFVVASLSSEETATALLRSFPSISERIAADGGSSARDDLTSVVQARLENDWRLPPGALEAAAVRILDFWDDAGVFVGGGAGARISPRIRLFLEVGDALYAAGLPDADAGSWARAAMADEIRHEALLLAATLSPAVVAEVVREVEKSPGYGLVNLLVDAAADGATVDVALVVPPALELVRRGDLDAWFLLEKLLRLDVSAELELTIVEAGDDAFDGGRRAVVRALAALRKGWRSQQALQWLEDVLAVEELEDLPGERDGAGELHVNLASTGTLSEAVIGTIDVLLEEGRDVGDAAEAARRVSLGDLDELVATLNRHGRRDLGQMILGTDAERIRPALEGLGRMFEESLSPEDGLRVIAALAETEGVAGKTVGTAEARRLDEVADLCETLNLYWVSAWRLPIERFTALVELVAVLGGFAREAVAAEAAQVLDLIAHWGDSAPFHGLFDRARARRLDRWNEVGDRGRAIDFFVELTGTGWYNTRLALSALLNLPQALRPVADLLEKLPHIQVRERQLVARALFGMTDDATALARDWTTTPDPVLRRVAATTYEHLLPRHGVDPLCALIRDEDANVREAALRFVEAHDLAADPAARAAVGDAARSAAPGWTCTHCGEPNRPTGTSCSACHVVVTDPRPLARSLLGLGSVGMGVRNGMDGASS